MNRRHAVLAAGLAIAGWLALFGDKTPATDIAEPVTRATPERTPAGTRVAAPAKTVAKGDAEPAILALKPRDVLIGATLEEKRPSGLFNSHSWTPPPPPAPKPPPPPPPTAPPLPFTYIGKKLEGGTWEVYLARGDQTVIVHAQSIIDGTYRVESIRPPQLVLTYLPLNQQQTLTIGGID
jgi:hypothetical protein